jgi:catechol 2,3-dioxygenase-like lactoylglutathione lyase family enzyme
MLDEYPMYTTVPVSDLQRATKWYREKLGFEPADDSSLPHGDEGIFFDAGRGTHFVLFPTSCKSWGAPGSWGWATGPAR